LDAGFIFADFDEFPPSLAGGENGGEKAFEFIAGDRFLKRIQFRPIRQLRQHGKRNRWHRLDHGWHWHNHRRRGGGLAQEKIGKGGQQQDGDG